jgi:hypothetical protein
MALDYSSYQTNPLQMAIQGYKEGGAINAAKQAQAIGSQTLELNQLKIAEYKKAQEKKDLFQAGYSKLMTNPSLDNINQFLMEFPEANEALESQLGRLNDEQRRSTFGQSAEVAFLLTDGNTDMAKQRINLYREAAQNSGDTEKVASLDAYLTMINSGQEKAVATILQTVMAKTGDPDNMIDNFGKLEDIRIKRAKSEIDLKRLTKQLEGGISGKVQSSEILADGTTILVTDDGNTHVRDGQGNVVTGEERQIAIYNAYNFKAAQRQEGEAGATRGRMTEQAALGAEVEGAKRAGVIGQEMGKVAFETMNKVRKSIGNIDAAIAAVDAGASSGLVESKFPSWNAATIELENMQAQLGLDVVSSVTFGALSEGELSLAMMTAMPKNLQPAELKDWLERKKASNQKLADYLSEQARFLLTPGNTLGKWMEFQGGKKAPTGAQTPMGETEISTQEEYDALPSGARYTDAQTGQKGTKP